MRFRSYRNYCYTLWIKNHLGKIGEHSIIEKPCLIVGGANSSISIGKYTCIQSHSILGCWNKYNGIKFSPNIEIGNHCSFGEYNHISAINKITIGNGLLTGRFVTISDNAHGSLSLEEALIPPSSRNLKSKGKIVIGNNVWIGDKATILANTHIGNNVIIGANSVVTSSIPDNCVAVGAPAKVIRVIEQ